MFKQKKQKNASELAIEQEVSKSIFVIPNPFDDFVRQKNGWYSKLKKMETQVKNMKTRVQELEIQQLNTQLQLQFLKDYCASLQLNKKRL